MPSSRKGVSKPDRIKIGREYEELAARFFLERNYIILNRNYQAGHKEIDLIVKKGNGVAFVEVKSAKSDTLGHPAERVTKKKRDNLVKAAQQYLAENDLSGADLRFDVVTFLDGKIEHYPGAFTVDEIG
jgi:putative endonuclease